MKELPLLRLLKIQAAIAYLGFIKKSRQICLYFLAMVAAMFLMCVGIILTCLSILIGMERAGVLAFGIILIVVSAVLIGFLLTQKAWMRIFEADKLIEDIAKGGEK